MHTPRRLAYIITRKEKGKKKKEKKKKYNLYTATSNVRKSVIREKFKFILK